MILKIFSPKRLAKKIGIVHNTANLCKNWTITFFKKNAKFLSTKMGENCDHNIDPKEKGLKNGG
jgi:hypothetical protein